MAFKIKGKKMYPISVFAKCCCGAWQACTQQPEKTKAPPQNFISFMSN